MKTKYVCRGFISPNGNFHYNRTMWSTILHVKICRWGKKEKEPKLSTMLMGSISELNLNSKKKCPICLAIGVAVLHFAC